MFTVIGLMFGGMILGYLFRRQQLSWIRKVMLLFLLGVEVGGNRRIMEGLTTLGAEALAVTLACILGSCLCAWGLWYWVYKRKGGRA